MCLSIMLEAWKWYILLWFYQWWFNSNGIWEYEKYYWSSEFSKWSFQYIQIWFVAIVSDLSRIVPKYYKRAYRMVHVDAGIALSYLQIIGEYVGVSSCIVAGFLEKWIRTFVMPFKRWLSDCNDGIWYKELMIEYYVLIFL